MKFASSSRMATRVSEKDWSTTTLGPQATWCRSLQTALRIMLTSRFAMWMGWGKELSFFYNDAYAPTLGVKQAWALGAPATEVWAEIWPAIGPRIEAVLTRGEATWDEGLLLFLERSGYTEETYHTFSYSPLPDDDGAIGGMLCVVTEETERVIGARRLSLMRELGMQLSATNSTAELFDAVTRCLSADARDVPFSLCYLFDQDGRRAELAARTALPADHPAAAREVDLGAPSFVWPLAAAQGGAERVVNLPPGFSFPTGPWAEPPTRALLIPIPHPGQAAPAGVFIAGLNPYRPLDDAGRDFLRLFVGQIAAGLSSARAYDEQRRRAAALAELDRAKTAFFSNVSHEFRTPLTLMLGPLTDLLAREGSPPGLAEQIAMAHRNGVRLLKLVNTMLDFSRIEAGRAQAVYTPEDLGEYTADLASVFRAATDRAGLDLVVDCPPIGEPVYVDRDMWEKIVLNLISNAFKFTLRGAITVRQTRADDHVELRVHDTGCGIPAAELPNVFRRFHRVESTKGRTHEGTGIGLALVQELARLHGGAVDVESEVGKGSTFTVTVKLGKAHLPAERIDSARERCAVHSAAEAFREEALSWLPDGADAVPLSDAAPESPAELSAPSGDRILLADDNADMREYVRRLLARRWTVEAVPDGRVALAAARARPPALVLTDVMMPNLDGFALLRELRADPRTRAVPVVMLSARAGEESKIEGLSAGADDYLVKPFSARELLARVETHLELSHLRVAAERHRERLEALFQNAPASVAVLKGPDHVHEMWNPLYEALVGFRPLLGRPVREAIPELVAQGYLEILDEVYRTGAVITRKEAKVTLKQGDRIQDIYLNFMYQPTFGLDGKVDGVLYFGFDVSDQVRARRKVEEAHEAAEIARGQAEAAVRMRDDFLSMASHELRTPLTTLGLQTGSALVLLKSGAADGREDAIGKLEAIQRQTERLEQLIEAMMDVNRITYRLDLQLEPVDLAAAAREGCARFQGGPSRVTLRADEPVVGRWDAGRLQQVFDNLLSNAVKYGRNKPIDVIVSGSKDTARLEVRDQGIGVAPEDQARIFERFERAASDRHFAGFGLGLWIVRRIVEAMRGHISVLSEPGVGSVFQVDLPRQP